MKCCISNGDFRNAKNHNKPKVNYDCMKETSFASMRYLNYCGLRDI